MVVHDLPELLSGGFGARKFLLVALAVGLSDRVLDANPQTRLVDMGVIPNQALQLAAAPL